MKLAFFGGVSCAFLKAARKNVEKTKNQIRNMLFFGFSSPFQGEN